MRGLPGRNQQWQFWTLTVLLVGRAGHQVWEQLTFAPVAVLRLRVSPVTFMFAFPASYDVRFGENVFFRFVLKVIHLFWMSFFETRVGVPSDGDLYGGQGMGVRTRQIQI